MINITVDGIPLSRIGPHSPITVETSEHGFERATWAMNPTLRHPALRGRALVQVTDAGFPIGAATLLEPGTTGNYTALGVWHQAETAGCYTTGSAPTSDIGDAIDGAASRGELAWGRRADFDPGPWLATNADELTLAQLLDGYAAEQGARWRVDTLTPGIELRTPPTTPQWIVPHAVAGEGLVPAEDTFYTHLTGTYLDTATTTDTETVGNAETAAVLGRRTRRVDLTPAGVMTGAKAISILNGMLARSGARMGWGQTLDLAHGQILNTGGRPAPLAQITSGQMVRLAGVVDTSRVASIPGYQDVEISTTTYTDGERRIRIAPVGYAARRLDEILTLALE